ncbi:MAG: hypothetical protein EBQ82_11385 [Betaproteobacteria bacterium]|nr:hypothetical protein [Betaproteobacteria bacterium]NBY05964.1 hypothetical protein [Betaproteobacteria bacterium]
MYLLATAWLYVTLMMAVAEATHAQGSLLGALITFVMYGLAPLALVLYLWGTPMRWRALKKQADLASPIDGQQPSGRTDAPNAGSESTTDPVSAVGKKQI